MSLLMGTVGEQFEAGPDMEGVASRVNGVAMNIRPKQNR